LITNVNQNVHHNKAKNMDQLWAKRLHLFMEQYIKNRDIGDNGKKDIFK